MVGIYRVSRMWISFYKASRTHKSKYMPAKFRPEKTINNASVSAHIEFKNRLSDFWHMHLLFIFFLEEDKFRKGKRIEMPAKKRHDFLGRRIIRICRHGFVGWKHSLGIPVNLVLGFLTFLFWFVEVFCDLWKC